MWLSDEVTIAQAIGGMRGVKSLVTDISYLDPQEGIRTGDIPCPKYLKNFPNPQAQKCLMWKGLYYLLLTGDIPTDSEVADVADEFRKRRILPRYVYDVIDAFPSFSPPMAIFSAAILTMQRESFFAKKYMGGISKMDYWDPTYEDSLNLLAKLPEVASLYIRKALQGWETDTIQSQPGYGSQFCSYDGNPRSL